MGSYRLKTNLFLSSTDQALKNYYSTWKKQNIDHRSGYASIDRKFYDDKYLSRLDPGPLKLYLFFCFVGKNETGISWHSIRGIADYFGIQTRTINNWIKELVENDLIHREKSDKDSHTTYLLPFSTTVMEHKLEVKKDKEIEQVFDLLKEKLEEHEIVFGKLIKMYHLFQWKKSKNDAYSNLQYLLLITERRNGVMVGHMYNIRRFVDDCMIDELDLTENSYFRSPLKFNNEHLIGIALTNKVPLNTTQGTKDLLEAIEKDLSNMDLVDFSEESSVQYGEFNEFFDEQLDDEEEEQ